MTVGIKHAVFKYLDGLKTSRIIGGWALRDEIARRTGYEVYPNVVLKVCKHYAFFTNGAFDCIDKRRSIYRFTPGATKMIGSLYENEPIQSNVKYYNELRSKA